MKWFKHYSNASFSDALVKLTDEMGLPGLARYWLLVELCASRWAGNETPIFTFSSIELRLKLRLSQDRYLVDWLSSSVRCGLSKFAKDGATYTIELPKLLEIFHRDSIPAGLRAGKKRALDKEEEREVELDKEKNPPTPPKRISTLPILTELVSYWNSFPQLPKVKAVSKDRKRRFKERFKEQGDKEKWVEVIKKISESDFCLANNDRGWVATFDWLLQPDTWVKVLEGKYDNRGHKNKLTHADRVSEGNKELFEKFRGDT